MRVPLTRYGWPEVLLLPLAIVAGMALLPLLGHSVIPAGALLSIELAAAALVLLILFFFRDPQRVGPPDTKVLLSPADGRVTDIEVVDEDEFIGGPALKIGIFMSIFDPHINRAPCEVAVHEITYKKGRFKDARDPLAAKLNEANQLKLARIAEPADRLIVRQISGAIARRIVCKARQGQKLSGGERFGMIKFGSRTELYLAFREQAKCLVKVGDKVKAGLTMVVRYE